MILSLGSLAFATLVFFPDENAAFQSEVTVWFSRCGTASFLHLRFEQVAHLLHAVSEGSLADRQRQPGADLYWQVEVGVAQLLPFRGSEGA